MIKAQISIEALMSIIIVITIVLIVNVYIIQPRNQLFMQHEGIFDATGICNSIAGNINAATYFGDGYQHTFTISPYVGMKEYNITIYDKAVTVNWAGEEASCRLVAKKLSFGVQSPPFMLQGTDFIVENKEGVVIIEEGTGG